MPAIAQNRFVDPAVLAGISQLDLIARTVVDGFVAGLHRSPDFGFSQEFAEYRAYTTGEDLRRVDWNVFARTGKAYLKRFRGETNAQIMVLLDCSASMNFASSLLSNPRKTGPISSVPRKEQRGPFPVSGRASAPVALLSKFSYAKFLASSLIYLAHLQRDATGLIGFHDEVATFVQPSSRQGQLMRLLHAIDRAETGIRTDFARPFLHLQNVRKRRGITILLSDFLAPVEQIISAVEPLRFGGDELILFHVLDREELRPRIQDPVLLVDMETDDAFEVSPEYARSEYPQKMAQHIQNLRSESQKAGLEYFLLQTDRPLDAALREYFTLRQRRI